MVGLAEVDGKAELDCLGGAIFPDLVQGLAAIDAGLTLAEHVQVGTVQDKDHIGHQKGFLRAGTSIKAISGGGKSASDFFWCPQTSWPGKSARSSVGRAYERDLFAQHCLAERPEHHLVAHHISRRSCYR